MAPQYVGQILCENGVSGAGHDGRDGPVKTGEMIGREELRRRVLGRSGTNRRRGHDEEDGQSLPMDSSGSILNGGREARLLRVRMHALVDCHYVISRDSPSFASQIQIISTSVSSILEFS